MRGIRTHHSRVIREWNADRDAELRAARAIDTRALLRRSNEIDNHNREYFDLPSATQERL